MKKGSRLVQAVYSQISVRRKNPGRFPEPVATPLQPFVKIHLAGSRAKLFVDAIRRIGDNQVGASIRQIAQELECVLQKNCVLLIYQGGSPKYTDDVRWGQKRWDTRMETLSFETGAVRKRLWSRTHKFPDCGPRLHGAYSILTCA